MTVLNLTAGNPSLARVKSIRSPKKYANISVAMLAPADASNLKEIAKVVFNESLEDNDSVVTIQFDDDKNFKRSYPPSLYSKDDQLVVKFGTKVFTFKESFGGADVSFSMVKLDKYDDACLTLVVEVAEDEFVELPLPLKLTDEMYSEVKDNGLTKLNGWLKKNNLAKIAASLSEVKEGSGASSNAPTVAITDLPENTYIKVTQARKVNASYGVSYILTVKNTDDADVQVWAPYSCKEALNLGAMIGSNTQMIYQNYQNKKGETRQNVMMDGLEWPVTPESAQIDLSIFA